MIVCELFVFRMHKGKNDKDGSCSRMILKRKKCKQAFGTSGGALDKQANRPRFQFTAGG